MALLSATGLFAQITATVQAPPTNQLKFDDLWSVELNNSSKKSLDVTLKADLSSITATNEIDPIAKATSNAIAVAPGTKKITKADITAVSNTWFKSGYEDLLKNGTLPSGTYQIEVTVVSGKGDELGWSHVATLIAPPAPPHLVAPTDGEVTSTPTPTFEWSAPSPLAPDAQVTYDFKIVELEPGQSTEEALKNAAWFEEPSATGTTLTYPADGKPFVKGAHYFWQVNATLAGATVGTSETWSFSPAPEVAEIDIGRGDIVAAQDLTMNQNVKRDLRKLVDIFDSAKNAIDTKDAKMALKWEKDALKSVNDILNNAGKTKEGADFIDKLRSARRKLEAEIGTTKTK